MHLLLDYGTGESSTITLHNNQPEIGNSESLTISISELENSTNVEIIDGQERSASTTVSIQIQKKNEEDLIASKRN